MKPASLLHGGNAAVRKARKAIVFVVGMSVVAVGVAMLILPGPAFVVIPAGVGILATEFVWARRVFQKAKSGGQHAVRSAKKTWLGHAVRRVSQAMDRVDARVYAGAAWAIAMMAAIGSVVLQHVVTLSVCTSCWYQRACLFPLAVLIPIGIFRRDQNLATYTLPLAVVGCALAVYEDAGRFGALAESLVACRVGAPCGAAPVVAAGVFLLIALCLAAHRKVAGSRSR